MTPPDTIDVARAQVLVRFFEAKTQAERDAAMKDYARLHQQKIARLMPKAQSVEPELDLP